MKWYHLDIRDITQAQFDSWYTMADDARRQKCDACREREDRLRSIAGDHLARTALAEHCGVAPEAIRFARNPDGKPYALGLDAHFNISHSGILVVCAVGDEPIGIDVQQMRAVRQRLAKKVCTADELAYVSSAPGWDEALTGEAMLRFFRVWTAKESYFKWTGTGITDLKSVETLPHILSGGTYQMEDYMLSIYQK